MTTSTVIIVLFILSTIAAPLIAIVNLAVPPSVIKTPIAVAVFLALRRTP
jgi:hypothetical protein